MIFNMYESDFGMLLNGVDYQFSDVDNFTIDDPEFTRITRGSNAANKEGIVYKEGAKEPKTLTVTIKNMSLALKGVLDTAYNDKQRIEAVYCIKRSDGSSKKFRNAILCQQPQQKSLDESVDSMNVELVFQSFDSSEVHKS